MRRSLHWLCLVASGLLLPLGACDDDGGSDADATADVADAADGVDVNLTGRSAYYMTAIMSDTNETLVLDRDLTGREDQYFAFGSTHIAPAVSLAMTDSVSMPRTMFVTINFGIVVPSGTHPIDTDGPGTYAFGVEPPEIEVTITGLEYRSRVAGSTGSVTVDEWSITPDETVRGSFAGRLIQDTPSANKRHIDVDGWFHFTLPQRQGGQPQ